MSPVCSSLVMTGVEIGEGSRARLFLMAADPPKARMADRCRRVGASGRSTHQVHDEEIGGGAGARSRDLHALGRPRICDRRLLPLRRATRCGETPELDQRPQRPGPWACMRIRCCRRGHDVDGATDRACSDCAAAAEVVDGDLEPLLREIASRLADAAQIVERRSCQAGSRVVELLF